jgi:hypothetical protein
MSASILSHNVRERLAKVCGLLGSDFDGERAEAARRATRILKDAGLTWYDLVKSAQPSRSPSRAKEDWGDFTFDHVVTARKCLERDWLWSEWELGFLNSIQHRRRLSPKQRAVLDRLVARTGGTE